MSVKTTKREECPVCHMSTRIDELEPYIRAQQYAISDERGFQVWVHIGVTFECKRCAAQWSEELDQ